MANIKIIGDAMVITSARKLEEICILEQYNPKALSLFETDEDGNKSEVFRVGSTPLDGSINQFGASFNGMSRDGNGFATITMGVPSCLDGDEMKDYVAEKIGTAIIKLNKVEEQFPVALACVEAERAQILANITVE